jgi:hypothetical protein
MYIGYNSLYNEIYIKNAKDTVSTIEIYTCGIAKLVEQRSRKI